jgi:hypothetical protein
MDLQIFVPMMSKYYDTDEYDLDPIKPVVYNYDSNICPDLSYTNFLQIK